MKALRASVILKTIVKSRSAQFGWSNGLVENCFFRKQPNSHFVCLTLMHGIDDEGNGHGQQNDSVNLRKWILIFGKGQNGNGSTGQHNGQVHPRQKGTFVGKKDFGFDLDGCLAWFEHGSGPLLTRLTPTKKIGEESSIAFATIGSIRLSWFLWLEIKVRDGTNNGVSGANKPCSPITFTTTT